MPSRPLDSLQMDAQCIWASLEEAIHYEATTLPSSNLEISDRQNWFCFERFFSLRFFDRVLL